MEPLTGEIGIELIHHNSCAREVLLHTARPLAARALIGKTPEQVLAAVPLLFALCGCGQAYAAFLACREALAYPSDTHADTARELLVKTEILREHAWRLLLDWPKLTGTEPDKIALSNLLKLDRQLKPLLFEQGNAFQLDSTGPMHTSAGEVEQLLGDITGLIDTRIFGGRLSAFTRLDSEQGLQDWLAQDGSKPGLLFKRLYQFGWQACGQSAIRPLPELDSEDVEQVLKNSDLPTFCRFPQWQGAHYETTPFGRQFQHPLIQALRERYHNGLLVRLAATMLDVAGAAETLNNPGSPSAKTGGGAGIGLAQVPAARGLLIHRAVFDQGRVQNYAIIAPTEWNFHPRGVVVESLMNLCAHNQAELKAQADLLIHAIDPCIKYQLKLTDKETGEALTYA